MTVFPAPALLACSFDPDVIRAVGRAVGLEMAEFGVQLWLGPDANVMRAPQKKGCAEQWSEDPVVCGTMTAALAAGAWPYGAVVLHAGRLPENAAVSQAALREVYGRPFELAAGVCRAAGCLKLRSPAGRSQKTARCCAPGCSTAATAACSGATGRSRATGSAWKKRRCASSGSSCS